MPRTLKLPHHSLAETQRLFASVVMRRLTPNYRTQKKLPDNRPTAALAESIIKPNDRLSSLERLEIYNRQYWFRLIDCFDEDFPTLAAALGPKKFRHLTLAYLESCPSRSFSLRNLGQFLIPFLNKHPEF